jgi:UDP-perosamine 4-acetyltransferase
VSLFIAGTGSFAAEISDWARAAGEEVVGLIEMIDPARVGSRIDGLPVLAPESCPAGGRAVLGLGGERRASWERLAAAGWTPGTIIHPAAHLASDAAVQEGAVVGPLAVIGAAARIGEFSVVSRGALVGHHTRVGSFVTLNPGANVGGNSAIESDAFVGMGAVIVDHASIGAAAVVAAGAVVLRDVAGATRVQGVPARPVAVQPGEG